jgi:hypothetical protein
MKKRNRIEWTPEEDEALWSKRSASQSARDLGKTVSACRRRMEKIGIPVRRLRKKKTHTIHPDKYIKYLIYGAVEAQCSQDWLGEQGPFCRIYKRHAAQKQLGAPNVSQ